MKTINAIVKVLTALAAIAGAVYIIATYGDKIVEWAKHLLSKAPQVPAAAPAAPVDTAPAAEEAPAEEDVTVEAPVCEASEDVDAAEVAEAPVQQDGNAPVADESDFEG